MSKTYNVLFLCTGNSARSILAEAILKKEGVGRFQAFSAGTHPEDELHPSTLRLAEELGFPTEDLRPESWNDFTGPDALELDFVFTVCDDAAGEQCPVWPGQPVTAHWGVPDPAKVEDEEEQREAFWQAYCVLQRRVALFLALPLESIDAMSLETRLREIGRTDDQDAA